MNRVKLRENTFKLLYCNDFHNRSEMPKIASIPMMSKRVSVTDTLKNNLFS